ncbi:FUSC family protein [Acetobacterium wieringae]|uniref:FUSC family protein n=1 Tax=Acetobacterium wieringae TaxID=52694 RepID=A0A5D0WIT4_9FIRM|nr:FUSC family protein [Acetobacterium wieringae]TYC84177.1 FUSC family protein [Acetobacterium wieringae]
MKKKLIKTAVLFISIVTFIALFAMVFGSANLVIAISTVFAILIYLSKNMTANPIKNLIRLVTFNVVMGIVAYISSINILLAIPIDFLSLFMIASALSYTISSPMSTPFSLQYVFLISFPVSLEEMPLRLAALAASAVCIMFVQLVVNKDSVKKQSKIIIPEICSGLENKISNVKNNLNDELVDCKIKAYISRLKQVIYESRKDNYYFNNESEIKFNVLIALENINDLLSRLKKDSEADAFLDEAVALINSFKRSVKDCDVNQTNHLDPLFDAFFQKYNLDNTKDLVMMKLVYQLQCLSDYLNKMKKSDQINKKEITKNEQRTNNFKSTKKFKVKLSIDPLSRSYAFRLAFAISVFAFIVNYFNLQHGNWILFTISSLTYPFYEISRQRTGKRIFGTIIGGIIVIILFSFLQLRDAGIIVMVITLFLTIFFMDNYTYSMIFSTITAISSFVLVENSTNLSLDRIIYVIIGGACAVLLSKLVLPYQESDAEKDLKKMYDEIIVGFFNDIGSAQNYTDDFKHKIMNFMLFTGMIEDKLSALIKVSNAEMITSFIGVRHALVLNIYNEYRWLLENKNCIKDYKNICQDISKNDKYRNTENDEQLIGEIISQYSLKNKVVVWESIEIIRSMNQLDLFKRASGN